MMRIGAYQVPVCRAAGGPESSLRRVEACRAQSEIHGKRYDRSESPTRELSAVTQSTLYRCDTGRADPLWYGPVLNASFVAQMIGQILPDASDASKPALGNYDLSPPVPRTRLLDKTV